MEKINVLDHGFIMIRNISGPTRRTDAAFDANDIDPANSARMSFDQMDSGRTRQDDLRLNDYLMRNWHTSPFEMVQIWMILKVPMFLGEQILRHRTFSFNKASGRYIEFTDEFYIPEIVGGKAKSNKQGQEDNLTELIQNGFKNDLTNQCLKSYSLYRSYLDQGVAPEHARLFLHANHYSTMLVRADLHNLMHFLNLRMDGHSQIETRAYANAIYGEIQKHLPGCMELFDKYRRGI